MRCVYDELLYGCDGFCGFDEIIITHNGIVTSFDGL